MTGRRAWLGLVVAWTLATAPSLGLAVTQGQKTQTKAGAAGQTRSGTLRSRLFGAGKAQGLRRLYQPQNAAKLAQVSGEALQSATITEEQYQAIAEVGLDVIKQFPPKAHRYVGLGRSPTQLVAFLQILEPERALNLPATGLRNAPSETLDPVYFEHFKQIIPDHLLARGETILLMDWAWSGASLQHGKALLQRYLEHRGFKNKVEVLAFTEGAKAINGLDEQPFHNIDLTGKSSSSPLNYMMKNNERGEYPGFIVGTNAPSELQRVPFYDQQKEALKLRMQHDEALDRKLTDGN